MVKKELKKKTDQNFNITFKFRFEILKHFIFMLCLLYEIDSYRQPCKLC
jgi:hypothetical protein